jgi:uncharacterized protein (TIGR02145 family)
MTRPAILLILMFGFLASFGQSISVTFSGAGAAIAIDSVSATNMRTNQQVTLPGNGTLVLAIGTGISPVTDWSETAMVFPNPFTGKTTFSMVVERSQKVYLQVQNLMGQVVARYREMVPQGENEFCLTVSAPGIYLVSLSTEAGAAGFKIICTETIYPGSSIQYLGSVSNHPNDQSRFNNSASSKLKASQTGYSLGYRLGDIMHYTCYSGIYTTIVTDKPVSSKNYVVDFAACTDRAGKNYSIVAIGSQTWMAENMAWLPAVATAYDGSDDKKYYYVPGYEGTSINEAKATANYKMYGTLYNSPAALNGGLASTAVPSGVRGICPEGWHLPSRGEVIILVEYLGWNAGTKLKSTTGWTQNGNGDNSRGFNAVPGGCRSTIPGYWAGFSGIGSEADLWTASESGWGTYGTTVLTGAGSMGLSNGYSVRCVKNAGNDNALPVASFVITPESGTTSAVFTFDASGSSDAETGADHLLFRWDWTGDGDWDTEFSNNPIEYHQFTDLSILTRCAKVQGKRTSTICPTK